MSKEQREIDTKLVQAYQSGNKEALTQLVQRWHKIFCDKAYWIVKDANVAKDIAQDSWNKIIEKIHDLRDPNTFASWSLRIVCNKSFDWVKKRNRTRQKLQTYNYGEEADDFEALDEKEQMQATLLKAIKTLPAHQQMVIRLFYAEDYSLKDISNTLNISEGTAKSRLYHAREKLKLILKNRTNEK
ncbi:RNA polymerase sigma factor [Seonamhaeicola maritimus]|uniref:RNA polymerase sigma factor n=1 Tax=Seonamhaeicola maritimus TaxID=2591822 RepID=A0A5C7GM67_9FLAO|nr:RNA polymerase sigma factor [Seonamhaeicola maritimus]TXG39422.1 RNA polymerase sigma factor [Seonamhaeicola maritimus]